MSRAFRAKKRVDILAAAMTPTTLLHSANPVCVDREILFQRDKNTCKYCGKKDLSGSDQTVDHIVPKSKGGTNDLANLVTCCHSCNELKADHMPLLASVVSVVLNEKCAVEVWWVSVPPHYQFEPKQPVVLSANGSFKLGVYPAGGVEVSPNIVAWLLHRDPNDLRLASSSQAGSLSDSINPFFELQKASQKGDIGLLAGSKRARTDSSFCSRDQDSSKDRDRDTEKDLNGGAMEDAGHLISDLLSDESRKKPRSNGTGSSSIVDNHLIVGGSSSLSELDAGSLSDSSNPFLPPLTGPRESTVLTSSDIGQAATAAAAAGLESKAATPPPSRRNRRNQDRRHGAAAIQEALPPAVPPLPTKSASGASSTTTELKSNYRTPTATYYFNAGAGTSTLGEDGATMVSSAERLGFDEPEKGGEDEATVDVMEPPGTVLYPESDLIGPLGPARVMLPASWVLPLLGWELMVIKGGTRVWRQKETEDFRPDEDEENEEAYDERRKDEGHENGEVDHWAFQGTDDDEDDDGSFGDRHVCYFSDDEVGGGGYGSF